jgi:hypothetical protein
MSLVSGYKVRLEDGSEVGPLDLDSLKNWYQEGLIGADTPTLKAGTRKWASLSRLVPIHEWGGRSRKRRKKRKADAPGGAVADPAPRWHSALCGLVLLAAGVAAGYAYFFPARWHPDLDGLPWRDVGLGALILALGLAGGWNLARRLVRGALLLVAVGAAAAGGLLFFREAGLEAWLSLAAAWLLLVGMIVLLAPRSQTWLYVALGLLFVAAGVAGVGRFAWLPVTDVERQVQEWAEPVPAPAPLGGGWKIVPPEGWVALRPGNPFAPPGDSTVVVLAEPRVRGFALARVDRASQVGAALDAYLDRVVEERRRAVPAIQIVDRSDVDVAGFGGRRAFGGWGSEAGAFQETATAWRDGWLLFGLQAWAPEGGAGRRQVETIQQSLRVEAPLTPRIVKRAAELAEAVTLLTPASARKLVLGAETLELSPEGAFQAAALTVQRGRGSLTADDATRLGELTEQLLDGVPRRQRAALAGYLQTPGAAAPGTSGEQLATLESGLASLPEAERLRLQWLWEAVILAAPGPG